MWLFFMKQQHMFSSLLNLLRRIGVNTQLLESRMAKAANIDDNIKRFYRDYKGRFFLVLLFHAMGWLLGACETFVILKTLLPSTGFQVAFLITALTVVINSPVLLYAVEYRASWKVARFSCSSRSAQPDDGPFPRNRETYAQRYFGYPSAGFS